MDQETKDLILKVMVAFTNHKERNEFIQGLTGDQYAALRDLNVRRIDHGDDRIPEDYNLNASGDLVER